MDNLNLQEALYARRLSFAKRGLARGFIAAFTWALFSSIMEIAGGMWPFFDVNYGVWMIALGALCIGAWQDFFAGVWLTIFNVSTGRGLNEFKRLAGSKGIGNQLIAGLAGGPFAMGRPPSRARMPSRILCPTSLWAKKTDLPLSSAKSSSVWGCGIPGALSPPKASPLSSAP